MNTLIKKLYRIPFFIAAMLFAFVSCDDNETPLPQVLADFTYTINIDTGAVTFINTSENANTYTWNFGDGTMSTEINPVKVYGSGTYTVELTAKNVAGAKDKVTYEIIVLIPEVATLPISFDGANTTYDAVTFNGATFSIVENPDPSGSNTEASMVAAITNSGAAYEGIFFDLGAPIDLTTDKTVAIQFWSKTPVDVLMKLEEGTEAAVETTSSHTGSGWETLYFTFDSAALYNRLTLFVDGPGTTSGTFYMDNLSQINSSNIPCMLTNLELPIDFDCNGIDYATKIEGNVSFTVIDNPELTGINATASKVGQITNVGAAWENAFFNLDVPVDFTTNKGISLKLYATQAIAVKLKFEDGTAAPIEADVNHTGSGWEELTFNFDSTASYNDMVIFVDGPGTTAGTFYVDDIMQVAGVVATPCVAETAQSISAADFNLTFMADPTTSIINDGANFEWIDNPDSDNNVNTSCKVGKITKLGQNPWDNNQIDLDAKLDFNTNTGLKIKVWSPRANTEVRIKLEEIGTPSNNTEQFLTTSVVNGWEELTFPFTASDSNKFNKIVIFLDLNANNTDTYYIDDLMLYGTGNGNTGTFDDGLLTNGDFEAGASPWIVGVDDNAAAPTTTENGNTYYTVNVTTATPDAPYNVNLSQKVNITQDATYTLTFDAWSDVNRSIIAGIGLSADPWSNKTLPVAITTVKTNYSITVTAEGFGAPNARVLFDLGAETGMVNIDNVALTLDSTGGGGGGTPVGGNIAVNGNFDTGAASPWLLFDNGGTAQLDNTLSNSASWSAKLSVNGGGNPGIKQEAIAAGSVAAGQTINISFDYTGAFTGEGALLQAGLFGEGASGASFTEWLTVPASAAPNSSWQTYTGSYTIPTGTDVSNGISFLIQAVSGGSSTANINIDNVVVTLN